MPDFQKTFARNFLVLFTGNSVGQLIPFLLAPFIARIFSPEELGLQENFLAFVSLIAIAAAGRYDLAIVLPKQKSDAVLLFRIGLLITGIVSLFALLPALFPEWISRLYNSPELASYTWYIAPAVLLLSLLSLLNNWTTRMGNYPLLTANRILQSLVQNCGYLILGYAGWGVNGLIAAWLIGVLAPVILLLIPSLKSMHAEPVPNQGMLQVAKTYRDFPMVNTIHAFTDIFATQFLIYWLITREYGVVALGLFAITNRYMRAPLNLVSSAVSQLYYKDSSAASGQAPLQKAIFTRSLKLTFILVFPFIILVMLAGPWLFETYLGDSWRESGEIARIMAPAIFFNFLASVVSSTPIIFDKQKKSYLINLAGYAISLSMLVFSSLMHFDFQQTLMAYSAALSVYYIVLLLWYHQLIKYSAQ